MPQPIVVVLSYEEMIDCVRQRMERLDMPYEPLEEVVGAPSRLSRQTTRAS
jgi:hypothetical protein